MQKYMAIILVGLALFSFAYGVYVGRYKVFPYKIISLAKNTFAPENRKVTSRNLEQHIRIFEIFSPKSDIVFIGDSITNEGRWSEFIPTLRVANRGIKGDKTSDILLRIDSILSTDPSKAFLMVGINDIFHYVSLSKILENYERIVDYLIAANIAVIIQSTIQCEVSFCGTEHIKTVNSLNEGLSAIAKSKGIKFHSLGKLSDSNGLDSIYSRDGVHLTAAGYRLWVKEIRPLLDF